MAMSKVSCQGFLSTCFGLLLALLDIVLDILAAVTLYQDENYVSLAILLLILLGSSILVQTFSGLWFSYDKSKRNTSEEKYPSLIQKCLSPTLLILLHVFQLGIYLRYGALLAISRRTTEGETLGDLTAYLSLDLSMLRLIESFSESAPQLVLMLTVILQQGHFTPVTALKASGSVVLIALSVTKYHCSLRSFIKDKAQQKIPSSFLYFLWNVFLIMPRIAALALFASVLPCYIVSHFLCSWIVLFFIAWRCKTNFMDRLGGEWLYRATVGLIWYFSWFNVNKGKTLMKMVIYHGYKVADISLLCGLWCWKMTTEEQQIQISDSTAIIIAVSVVLCYVVGLVVKLIYYKRHHPSLTKEGLKEPPQPVPEVEDRSVLRSFGPQRACDSTCYNERMGKMAENFFTS